MMLGDTFISFVLYGFRDSIPIIIQSRDVFDNFETNVGRGTAMHIW